MDVERTVEFILEAQAKAEVRMQRLDSRLDSVLKLVQQGMRILVAQQKRTDDLEKRSDARFARVDKALEELAKSQKVTDQKLQAFLAGMRRGRNGH